MQKANRLQGRWRNAIFLLAAILVVVADQLSKVWIKSNLAVGESLPGIGFLRLTHIRNTGAAFGFFQGESFTLAIVSWVVITILLIYVLFVSRRLSFLDSTLGKTALGLIFGAAIGNLIDRLRFGYVTDFIDVGFWPAFNVADSAVTIGVILFACSLLFLAKAREH